jgi:hypothetical protein
MGVCDHTSWLSFHEEGDILMQRTDRLTKLVTGLDAPEQKWPSLVLLLGHSNDALMKSEVLPRERKLGNCRLRNTVHLQLDTETAFSDRPILFAYGDPPRQIVFDPEPAPALCHNTTSTALTWPDPTPAQALNALYYRLLSPFAGVVCLFMSYIEKLEDVAKRLELWHGGTTSTSNLTVRPRLLLVCESSDTRSSETVYTELMKLLDQKSVHIDGCFSSISVFAKSSSHVPLKDRIRQEANFSYDDRVHNHLLLNAIHLDHFFGYACDRFADHKQDPFNFVRASRSHRPVPAETAPHLTELLTYPKSYEELKTCVTPLIAEYMILDHYTYEVHCKFTLSAQHL